MSVKVAVRVRPFNNPEIQSNQISCISMDEKKTILFDSDCKKEFLFDHSFWSHDQYEVDQDGYFKPLPNLKYSDQKMIYYTFSQDMFSEQNCSVLAYGQQRAGRTFQIYGTNENQGLIFNFVKEIFQKLSDKPKIDNLKINTEVFVSMLLIYQDKVYDMFSTDKYKVLIIKENQYVGVYVENLTKELVLSTESLEAKIKAGRQEINKFHTYTSILLSGAHIVTQIQIKETKIVQDQVLENSKIINFVDLACSDKYISQNCLEAQKLFSNIAASLTTLGEIICNLQKKTLYQTEKLIFPYRCSKLTRILQNSLSINSKIILICTISPALNQFKETLSTLRFANQFMKFKLSFRGNLQSTNQQSLEKNQISLENIHKQCLQQNQSIQISQLQTLSKNDQKDVKQQILNQQEQQGKQEEQLHEIKDNQNVKFNLNYSVILQNKDGCLELQHTSQEAHNSITINNCRIKESQKLAHDDIITFGNTTTLLVQYLEKDEKQSNQDLNILKQDSIQIKKNEIIKEDKQEILQQFQKVENQNLKE